MNRSWLVACLAVVMCGTASGAQESYPLSIPAPIGSAAPEHKQYSVRAHDGTKLHVHEWAPPKPAADKPVILFLHGIGMHGEPYASIAHGFTAHGVTLVAPDLRGHGRSEGKPGELPPAHVLRADLGAVIGSIDNRHPGVAVVLAGESMGGLLAADYAWRGERRLAGLALLAPAFDLLPVQKLPDPLDAFTPGFISLDSDIRLGRSTRVPGFIKGKSADPLALHKVPFLTYLPSLLTLQLEWATAGAALKLPLHVSVGGKDQVVDSAATKRFYERVATPKSQKTWRQWDEAYHTLCWDPVTPELVEALAQWAMTCPRNGSEKSKE